MAVFDDTAEKKLLLYPHRVDWASRTPKAVKAEAVAVELEKAEPLKQECRHFLDCVANRRAPLTDGREGLRVLQVLGRLPAVAGSASGSRPRRRTGRRPRNATTSPTRAPTSTSPARSARARRSGTSPTS